MFGIISENFMIPLSYIKRLKDALIQTPNTYFLYDYKNLSLVVYVFLES